MQTADRSTVFFFTSWSKDQTADAAAYRMSLGSYGPEDAFTFVRAKGAPVE